MNKAIKVSLLRFASAIDVPGKNSAEGLKAVDVPNRAKTTILYHPWMRHFRVEHQPLDGPSKVAFIHESNVLSWTPDDSEQ